MNEWISWPLNERTLNFHLSLSLSSKKIGTDERLRKKNKVRRWEFPGKSSQKKRTDYRFVDRINFLPRRFFRDYYFLREHYLFIGWITVIVAWDTGIKIITRIILRKKRSLSA